LAARAICSCTSVEGSLDPRDAALCFVCACVFVCVQNVISITCYICACTSVGGSLDPRDGALCFVCLVSSWYNLVFSITDDIVCVCVYQTERIIFITHSKTQ
jgi:hypothetical protein